MTSRAVGYVRDFASQVRLALRLIRARPWLAIWPAVLIWMSMTTREERRAYFRRVLCEAEEPGE